MRNKVNKKSFKKGETFHQSGSQPDPLAATSNSVYNRGFDALVDEMVGADTSLPNQWSHATHLSLGLVYLDQQRL